MSIIKFKVGKQFSSWMAAVRLLIAPHLQVLLVCIATAGAAVRCLASATGTALEAHRAQVLVGPGHVGPSL